MSRKKTVEITQLDVVEKIVKTQEIQNRIQQRTLEQIVDVPVQRVVEEQAEASKVFFQNRVQQSFRGQTAETPAISFAEKTVEMLHTQTQDKTQHDQVTKHVEIPQLQIVEKTVEAAKHIQQERVKELRSKFEVGHMREVHARNRSDKKNRSDLTNQRHVLAHSNRTENG